jgi:hypothetical protein
MLIDKFRQQFPELSDVDTDTIVKFAHQKYKPEMKYEDFASNVMGYEPSKYGRFIRGVGENLKDLVPSVITGLGAYYMGQGEKSKKPEDDLSYKLGKGLINWSKGLDEALELVKIPMRATDTVTNVGVSAEEKKTFSSKLGTGGASMAQFIAVSPAKTMGQFGLLYGQNYMAIEERKPEWSDSKKREYAFNHGLSDTVLEKLGTSYILSTFKGGGKVLAILALQKSKLFGVAKGIFKGYVSESTQELTQEFSGNVIDKLYKLDGKLTDGLFDAWLIGGIIGGGVSTVGFSATQIEELRDLGLSEQEIEEVKGILDNITKEALQDKEAVAEASDIIKKAMANDSKDVVLEALKDKVENPEQAVNDLLPDAIEDIATQYKAKETAETEEAYEVEKLNMIQDAMEAGLDMDVSEQSVKVFDAMVESYSKTLGTTKIDLLKKIPLQRVFSGDMKGGLKQSDALTQEARKYKSAEEFVKGQSDVVYHGTMEDFEKFELNPREIGIHFGTKKASEDRLKLNATDSYSAKLPEGSIIKEVVLDIKNPLKVNDKFAEGNIDLFVKDILNNEKLPFNDEYKLLEKQLDEFNQYERQAFGSEGYSKKRKELEKLLKDNAINFIKNSGFDGLIYNNRSEDRGSISRVVFSPDQIKTKQQLTEIWNKAQESKTLNQEGTIKAENLDMDNMKNKYNIDEDVYSQYLNLKGQNRSGSFMPEPKGNIGTEKEAVVIKLFGETTNEDEASYITTEGRYIDGTGKAQTGNDNWDYMNDRSVDHREIAQSIMPSEGTQAMIDFMDEGSIRINITGNELGLDIANNPTEKQMNVISRLIKNYDGNLDISDSKGDVINSITFNSGEQSKVVKFIKSQYEGTFDINNANILKQEGRANTFYSQLEATIEQKMPKRATPEQIKGIIKEGIKQEEIEWSGIMEFIEGKESLTKEEVLTYLQNNGVQLEEVVHRETGNRIEEVTKQAESKYGVDITVDANPMDGSPDVQISGDKLNDMTDDEIQELQEEVQDYVLGEIGYDQETETKYSRYVLEGGENYKEILITLPTKKETGEPPIGKWDYYKQQGYTEEEFRKLPKEQAEAMFEEWKKVYDEQDKNYKLTLLPTYTSSHFSEKNILTHIRINDRVDAEGNKVLFIEEVQSDWHQQGRKDGYKSKELYEKADKEYGQFMDEMIKKYGSNWGNEITQEENKRETELLEARMKADPQVSGTYAVPDAPFKKTWHELAMKRMLRYAVENGYDKVAWTTGEQQAERYKLSKQVSALRVRNDRNGEYTIMAELPSGGVREIGQVAKDKLADAVGKDLAEKIINQEEDYKKYEGLDLKVGGEGMKGFYDNILPNYMNKLVKKWDSKVENMAIKTGEDNWWVQEYEDDYDVMNGEKGEIEDTFKNREDAQKLVDSMNAKAKSLENVHSVEVTPKMRESVIKGLPLFQEDKGSYKSVHGEAMLRLFKAKDQSTFIHELSHYFLDLVLATNPEFIRPVMNELGLKDVKKKADYVKLQEYFARSNEAYLREGKSPKTELDSVFAKFKEWLHEVYKKLSDMEVQLTPTMRAFFDSLYTGEKMDEGIELYQKEIKSISEYTEQLLRTLGIGLKVTKKDIDAEVSEKEAMQANHPRNVLKDYEKIYVPEGMRADMKNVIDAYKTKFTTKIKDGIAFDVILPELAEIMGVDESQVIDAMDNATKNYLNKAELRAKAKTELMDMQNIKPEMTIKQLQTELTKFIQGLDIEAKDKAKFIGTIKEATTNTRLANILKRVSQRAINYKKTQMKKIVDAQITKELKQTKDIKKGQLKIGKYDYDTNKLFKKLREYSRLTKEFAFDKLVTLEQEYEEQMDTFKRIELSLLSWKTNGADGTYELSKRVLDDIQLMKAVGELAKDDADFERRVNRHAEGQEIMDSLLANKMNKNIVTKKIAEYYARGFGDIYSTLLAITSGKIAELYNLEIEESNRDANFYERSTQITKQAEEILGSKKEVLDMAKDNEAKYTITDKNNEDYKLTKMQLLHMYVMLKNEHYRNAYNYHYNLDPEGELQDVIIAGETYQVSSQIADLLSNLTEQEIDIADMLQNEIQDYYAPMNEIYIKRTGKDMGRNEEYFPGSSEHQEDFVGDFKMTTNIPSSMKERAKGMPRPTPQNIWNIALKHIAQAEHTINITDKLIETRQILEGNVAYDIGGGKQKKIKNYIEDTYGKEYLGLIKRSYEDLNLGSYSKKLDLISGIIRRAVGNWVGAKIAMNPRVFVLQLTAMTNYSVKMPVGEWAVGVAEGMTNPKQTWEYMMANPYLKARINQGYMEAIVAIMNDNKNSSWAKMMTSFTRYGDIISIIYGGYPYMKYLEKQGYDAKTAEEKFRSATIRSMQSGLKSSRSELQKTDSLMFLTAFMNTPTQYLRMPVNASIQFANGEIGREDFAKIMINYLVLQPMLYTSIGYILNKILYGDDDEEDSLLGELFWSIIISPFNAIPLLNGIAMMIARKLQGKKSYKAVQVMLLDDINLMAQKMGKKEKTMFDYLLLATTPTEVLTMMPAKTAERFYVKNMERFFGKKDTKGREYARRN